MFFINGSCRAILLNILFLFIWLNNLSEPEFLISDIFGLKATDYHVRKFGGPFKDELIAGGYLQRFSLLTFYVFAFLNIDRFLLFSIVILLDI